MSISPPNPASAETRRLRARVLVGSGLVNVLLVGLLVWSPGRPGRATGQRGLGEAGAAAGFNTDRLTGAGGRFPGRSQPSGSGWSRLESTNFLEYAANLRRAGCPDETVCDVLRPAIQRAFEAWSAQTYYSGEFWATGDRRREQRERTQRKRAAWQEEQDRLLAELTCPPSFDHEVDDPEVRLIIDLIAGFLGSEAESQVLQLVAAVEPRVRAWRERIGNVLLPEDVAALEQERDAFQARLRQLLSADQQEEVGLRLFLLMKYAIFNQDEGLGSSSLTSGELRELCRIQASAESNPLNELIRFQDLLEDEPPHRSEPEVNAELRALLGEERYAAFRRHNDKAFQQADVLASEFKLPPDFSAQVYQTLEQLRAEVPALQAQWDADRAGTRQTLLERRDAFRARLEELLAGVPENRRKDLIRDWTDEAIRTNWRQP